MDRLTGERKLVALKKLNMVNEKDGVRKEGRKESKFVLNSFQLRLCEKLGT